MNPVEIDGRISALVAQRNQAMDQVAMMNGELAVAKARVAELEKELASVEPTPEPEPAK